MKKTVANLVILCLIVSCTNGATKAVRSNSDGSEAWGYVEVRPKAHMFWWYYKSPYRVEDSSKPWPIILWLQGGPGASGVGIGNFQEVGPLDTFLRSRNSTWLKKADLLFVDSPVGSGYSFVEGNQKDLYVKSDEEAAKDLTKLLQQLFNKNQTLNQSPLFIVAESYGGKIAVKLGLSVFDSVKSGKLKLHLGGVVLGDSWISPEDFVLSWGPLLKYVSRLDDKGFDHSNSLAQKIKKQIKNGEYVEATETWMELESVISSKSNSVDFYNFLLDSGMDPVSLTMSEGIKKEYRVKKYSRYLNDLRSSSDVDEGDLDKLMNGVIKKKLKIIPKDLMWGNNSGDVFSAMEAEFMIPTIDGVDELLAQGIDVTIYNGQLDVICSTSGTEAWVHKLKRIEVNAEDEETTVEMILEEATREIHRSVGVRMHRLGVCEWEMRLWLVSSGLANGAWRVVVANVTGRTCNVHIYREVEATGRNILNYHSITKQGPLHGTPVNGQYRPLNNLERKRLAARRSNTTYCYDFPLSFETALELLWTSQHPGVRKPCKDTLINVKELVFSNPEGSSGTSR